MAERKIRRKLIQALIHAGCNMDGTVRLKLEKTNDATVTTQIVLEEQWQGVIDWLAGEYARMDRSKRGNRSKLGQVASNLQLADGPDSSLDQFVAAMESFFREEPPGVERANSSCEALAAAGEPLCKPGRIGG